MYYIWLHMMRMVCFVFLHFVNAIIASDPRVARATTTMAVLRICAVSSPFWCQEAFQSLLKKSFISTYEYPAGVYNLIFWRCITYDYIWCVWFVLYFYTIKINIQSFKKNKNIWIPCIIIKIHNIPHIQRIFLRMLHGSLTNFFNLESVLI